MADSEFSLTFDTNNIARYVEALGKATDLGLDTWCEKTVQQADAAAPVASGHLRESRYVISALRNEFRGDEGVVEPAVAVGEHEAALGFGASYARYVNDGHHTASGSFVAANPFFDSATQGNLGTLADEVADKINGIRL